jgi:2-dehydropantoate 2-reductase
MSAHTPEPSEERPEVAIDGLVARPRRYDARALAAVDARAQVADVSLLVPGRKGRAVRLAALLDEVGVDARAAFVDVSSTDPAFAVSEPLAVLRSALVVYELDGAPLPAGKGGPFRLLVPGHADECVHVKGLARLALAAAPGRDTRPVDDAEHAELHARKRA